MRPCKILSLFCKQNHQTQYSSLLNLFKHFQLRILQYSLGTHTCQAWLCPPEVPSLSYALGLGEQGLSFSWRGRPEGFLEEVRSEQVPKGLVGAVRPRREEW